MLSCGMAASSEMSQPSDLHLRSPPSRTHNSSALAAVAHLRVCATNPPTSSISDGLDYVRCSELHNALVRYAWEASGYEPTTMPEETWWEYEQDKDFLETIETALHPTLQEYLKRVLLSPEFPEDCERYSSFLEYPRNPRENNFHRYAEHLAPASEMLGGFYSQRPDDEFDLRIVGLYLTDPNITESMIGVV